LASRRADDEKEKRERERERKSVFSNGSNVRFETFLFLCVVFFAFFSLSLSLSVFHFFFPQNTYRLVCFLFSPKNKRFEFAAPKYYDFVSHNSAEGKKNRTKESKTAEMYFESEKPSGECLLFFFSVGCFTQSESLVVVGAKPLPSLLLVRVLGGGPRDFFENSRGCTLFSFLFSREAF
jgi:hypothetical protein